MHRNRTGLVRRHLLHARVVLTETTATLRAVARVLRNSRVTRRTASHVTRPWSDSLPFAARVRATLPRHAVEADPRARGSPRRRPCRCDGRTRAPSGLRARDLVPRRARAVAGPALPARRGDRRRLQARGGTAARPPPRTRSRRPPR